MTFVDQPSRVREPSHRRSSRSWQTNTVIVTELARLLLANPRGLRRWSVMRAMRKTWQIAHQEVSLKFEDEIERNFRHFSADSDGAKTPECKEQALFFRPSEKAGEVWAVNPERARAWLNPESSGAD